MPVPSRTLEKAPLRWFFPPPPRRRSMLQRLGRHAVGALTVADLALLRALPVDVCSLIGSAFWGEVGLRRFADVNVRIAEVWSRLRPSASDAAPASAVAPALWRHIGRVLAEYAVLDRLWPQGRIAVTGAEHLATARSAGQPVILMCLHLGNWETIGVAVAELGYFGFAVYQAPSDSLDHWALAKARQRYLPPQTQVIAAEKGGALAVASNLRNWLEKLDVCVVFADEWIEGRVSAPAFGRALRSEGNVANIARLAVSTGASVIPCYALRSEGAHSQVRFLPPIDLLRSGKRAACLAENLVRINAAIEPIVRAHLDQWLMLFDLQLDD